MESKNSKSVDCHKTRLYTFISLILIVILGIAAYANSINGEFVWDDESIVEKNVYITSVSHIPDIFAKDISGYGEKSRSYRPVQMLTYMLDHSIWKLDVRGYHITNIILHILAALSIYWLINILY
ncbi:MAG: hypothetical protein ABH843_01895, partial [Candidatus Omnitrophota bacterium]